MMSYTASVCSCRYEFSDVYVDPVARLLHAIRLCALATTHKVGPFSSPSLVLNPGKAEPRKRGHSPNRRQTPPALPPANPIQLQSQRRSACIYLRSEFTMSYNDRCALRFHVCSAEPVGSGRGQWCRRPHGVTTTCRRPCGRGAVRRYLEHFPPDVDHYP